MSIRCFFGIHSIPKDTIISVYGAIFRGGACKRCGEFVKGKFLYNSWGIEENLGYAVKLSGVNPKLKRDLESGKYRWAE